MSWATNKISQTKLHCIVSQFRTTMQTLTKKKKTTHTLGRHDHTAQQLVFYSTHQKCAQHKDIYRTKELWQNQNNTSHRLSWSDCANKELQ